MINETEVIHEDVRKSLGGSGEITGDDVTVAGFSNGVAAEVSSDGGTVPAHGATTDLVWIKNTGVLVAGGAAVAADTVEVMHDEDIIATLKPGEALALPKPSGAVLTLGSGSADVNVEVLSISSAA